MIVRIASELQILSSINLSGDGHGSWDYDVLWDGEVAIAVDKPAGLSTQAPPGAESLESILRVHLAPRTKYVAFPHRLDRPVGGVILVALRKRAAQLLSEQFAARKVVKQYLAAVAGRVETEGYWDDFVAKLPDQPRAAVVDPWDPQAKHAKTRVEIVAYDSAKHQTLLKLIPETGRMHQLRVQAAHRGHPIDGDTLYGGAPAEESKISLQAQSLTFHDPRNGKRIVVTSSDQISHSFLEH